METIIASNIDHTYQHCSEEILLLTLQAPVKLIEKGHKHPLQRSAFTFSENYIPSRLDFAKERFGGQFTTEQVENVKIFLRILLILFALGLLCLF